ncbi:sporulation protein YqfD [Bacillus fengqiuensis]|nr:sporulation protein YqfD [Bacillus fengqiuensis]
MEQKGTTYHIRVVEKNEPRQSEAVTNPQNLVARKRAVIVEMFVEKGDPVVKVHDYVKPGQLLVSGVYGKEDQTISVPSKGKILGETWYQSKVELPLKSNYKVFNGNEKKKYYLEIGNFSMLIWGFGKPEFTEFESDSIQHNVRFIKWDLPISFVTETIRESEKVARKYSKDEAIKMARETARRNIKDHIPEDAVIKDEEVLKQSVKDGKLNVTVFFKVIENIAVGQPIN